MSLLDTASLIVTPNAYKEGKLYSVIPSDGSGDLSVTRATTATRVNSAGLVELVPYNLLSYSERFENAYWSKLGATVTSNSTTSPSGTLTADTLIETAVTNVHETYRTPSPATAGTYTLSVHVKNTVGSRFLNVSASNLGTDYASVRFSPSTATLSSVVVAGSFSNGSASFEALGNGWYRVTLTYTCSTTSVPQFALSTDGSNSNVGSFGVQSYLGDGTSGVYLWGAQLVEGTEAKDYYPTETRLNIPRLDYSNGTCPSILVEPQRTNLVLSSEDFTNVAYWNNSNTTNTANQTISPNGTLTADRVNGNAVNTFHRIYRSTSISASTSYTFSVYVKADTLGFIQLALNNGFTTNYLLSTYANFNLTTGVVSQSGNGATAKIESLGNDWYRCSITATSLAGATSGEYNINLINSGTLTAFQSWAGTTSDSVYLWGAQLEAGAYATSYIPTTSASVTRNYDIPSLGNNYTSGRITAAGGTWFTHLINNVPRTRDSGGGSGLRLTNVAANNFFHISTPNISNQRYWIRKVVNLVNTDLYNTLTDEVKIAINWNGTTADIFVNGVKVIAATAFTSVDLENLNVNNGNIPYNINAMALWPTPLTDDQLEALTTI